MLLPTSKLITFNKNGLFSDDMSINKKKRIVSVPNYAVLLFVWTLIYILLLSLGDEPLYPMILLCGFSFVGYMVSLFQVVVIRSNRSISSFYPFRLKRITIESRSFSDYMEAEKCVSDWLKRIN